MCRSWHVVPDSPILLAVINVTHFSRLKAALYRLDLNATFSVDNGRVKIMKSDSTPMSHTESPPFHA